MVIDDIKHYLEYQITIGLRKIMMPDRKAVEESTVPEVQDNQVQTDSVGRDGAPTDNESLKSNNLVNKKAKELQVIRNRLGDCTRCPLHEGRKNIVFGEGNSDTELMFVGEGPGADEDAQGRPFVGAAGKLLTKMIQAMTLQRDEVYIANVVKCRPPGNRDPETIEIQTCKPFLDAQIEVIKPTVIVALGRVSAQTLLNSRLPIGKLRGRFHDINGIAIMPTYHPSFLLRWQQNDEKTYKAQAWSDLKSVMKYLHIKLPGEK